MKTTKVSLDMERQIITNLIVSKEFCTGVLPMLQPKYFKTKYAKSISSWIREYFDRYQDAPGELIQSIYQEKKNSIYDDEEAESVLEVLVSLSDEYDENKHLHNIDYAIEQAVKYLKLRSIELLKEDLERALVEGEPVKGEAVIANFSRIGRPEGDTIDILHNKMDIIDAFLQEDEILFTLPGVLKDTVGPFKRGDLSAWIGPPKSSKTFALMFTAEQALWAGLRVAFFSLEMRKPQLIRRAWQGWNGQPIHSGYVMIPRFELISEGGRPGDELYAVENDKKMKDGIDLSDIEEIQDKIRKRFGGGDIRFIALPAYSATVEDIVAHIDNLTWYDNFPPDVVIIDYADIVKPSKGSGTEYRHQLDSIWKGLRALAQSRNIHVCTASQTNRAGMRGDVELEHVAEDMRKLTHVSLLLALNRKPEEREINVLRVKTLLNRDDSVVDGNEAVVLNQFALGKFYLDSKLRKNVEKTDVVD